MRVAVENHERAWRPPVPEESRTVARVREAFAKFRESFAKTQVTVWSGSKFAARISDFAKFLVPHESHEPHEESPKSAASRRLRPILMRMRFWWMAGTREAREPREESPRSHTGQRFPPFLASRLFRWKRTNPDAAKHRGRSTPTVRWGIAPGRMRVKRAFGPEGSRRWIVGLHSCLSAKHGFLHRRACYGVEVQYKGLSSARP